MTDSDLLSRGWALIAEGAQMVSLAYAANEQPGRDVVVSPSATAPADPIPQQDEGSLAQCPKHRVPYEQGQYGPYCKQATDDPAWGKQKGDRLWCRITPKNAHEWLQLQAAAY